VLLKLLLELYDMLKDKFLLGCIFLVGNGRRFFILEVSASLVFLVDNYLPSLEELLKLLVCLTLHLKKI
jgi:hypothetical protein